MTVSIHDNQLVSNEVQCEKRTITLRTEFRECKPTEFTNVVFEGVQGHRFENDAFGNIIFDVSNVPVERFLTEYGAEMSELHRMNGSPTRAADLGCRPGLGPGTSARARNKRVHPLFVTRLVRLGSRQRDFHFPSRRNKDGLDCLLSTG